MLFDSLSFLIFFPSVVLIYFILPHRFKLFFLFLASCIFYISAVPVYLLVIFLSIFIDYFSAIIISKSKKRKRKIFLCVSLITNIGLLCIFKYFNFFNQNLSSLTNIFGIHYSPFILYVAIPIGLSFHTFQGMSYVIEVYKKNFKPEKNLLKYASFIMFFPQLVAGPIERPQQLLPQFSKKHIFNYDDTISGLRLMLWGMFKKVAIADRIGVFVDPVFADPHSFNGLTIAVATVLYAFQIYYDFSGYTDIARGAARILGYRLEINFNNPYISSSIQDFWRRWHITLSNWFRDYVYIPLGGNRKGKLKLCRNLLITFFLCGLWHGASWHFVIWGVLNGVYLIIFNIWNDRNKNKYHLPSKLSIIITFATVCITWIFFRANSVSAAIYMIKKIFTYPFSNFQFSEIGGSIFLEQNKFEFLIVIVLIFIVETVQIWKSKVFNFLPMGSKSFRWAMYISIIWIIILAEKFGQRQFIYFAF